MKWCPQLETYPEVSQIHVLITLSTILNLGYVNIESWRHHGLKYYYYIQRSIYYSEIAWFDPELDTYSVSFRSPSFPAAIGPFLGEVVVHHKRWYQQEKLYRIIYHHCMRPHEHCKSLQERYWVPNQAVRSGCLSLPMWRDWVQRVWPTTPSVRNWLVVPREKCAWRYSCFHFNHLYNPIIWVMTPTWIIHISPSSKTPTRKHCGRSKGPIGWDRWFKPPKAAWSELHVIPFGVDYYYGYHCFHLTYICHVFHHVVTIATSTDIIWHGYCF